MGKRKKLQEIKRQSKHWLVWLIYGCATLAVMAAILTPTDSMSNYSMIKTLPYQLLVEIMLAAWVALAVADKKYRPHWNVLTIALAFFAAVIGVSLFFSQDPALSFWSTSNRLLGVVTTWHHIVWLFVLAHTLHDRRDWIKLFKMSGLIAFAVIVITAVLWSGNISDRSLVKSVFGNTSYLASYMLPHVFIALFLWAQEKSSKKYFWLLTAFGAAFSVVLTGSRAGILSLLIAGLLTVIGLALVSKFSRGKKFALITVSVSLFALMIAGFFALRTEAARAWIEQADRLPGFVTRVAHRDFGGDRLVLWNMAFKGIAERPLFGWGNEQFFQVSSIYLDMDSRATEVFSESWFDRSHNQYLDYAISYGLVGLAAYLLVWLAVAYLLVRTFRRSQTAAERRELVILAMLFVCYLGYSVFFFDTPQLLMILFMAMAWLLFLSRTVGTEDEQEPAGMLQPSTSLFVGLLVPLMVFGWFANVELFIANRHFVQGAAWMTVDWHKARQEMEMAFSERNPYRFEVQSFIMEPVRQSIDVSYNNYRNKDGLPEFMALVADTTAEAVANHPHSIKNLYLAVEAHRYNYLFDESALDKATEFHERFMAVAPERFDAHLQMAELEVLRGNLEESLPWFDSAYERHFQLSGQYGGYILFRKACVQAELRDFAGMAESIVPAAKTFPTVRDPRLILALGEAVQPGDDLSGFEPLLDQTLTNLQKSWEVLAAGAKIYRVLGHEDMVTQVLEARAMQELLETEEGRAEYEKLLVELGR